MENVLQIGYNQTSSPYASPVMSQPSSMQQPPTSMYNSQAQSPYQQPQQNMPPLQQQSPYQQQYQGGGLPEGPVGGISGYDPQLHAKMAGMSVHSSFSKLWVSPKIQRVIKA